MLLLLFAAQVTALYSNASSGIIAPCDSQIFCQGPLLRDVELARPYSDSKTFVDQPTIRPVEEVLAAYANLSSPLRNDSVLQSFLAQNFGPPGMEIARLNESIPTNATFVSSINSTILADFVTQIIGIWPTLTREYVGGMLCDGCESSFVPVNRSFVVAGGRFREYYYWDSFWIIEGLLRTGGGYTQIAENIILNFLDLVDEYGFVPNGGRKYYLNRSQPPLLTQMVRVYIEYTNDTSLLSRALPTLVKEQSFWTTNNTILVNSTSGAYNLSRYTVLNNQPRPESYFEDYQTVNNATFYINGTNITISALNDTQKSELYANLAAGAESGWDYSSRWIANVSQAINQTGIPLRTLNTMNIIPVDLNAILYGNEFDIAYFYQLIGRYRDAKAWSRKAARRKEGMFMTMYNSTMNGFFDYNLTSSSQNTHQGGEAVFSPSQYYPFWTGAAPDEILYNATIMSRVYQPVKDQLSRYPGGVATSSLKTGQQWDSPNVWAPLQYILIQGSLGIDEEMDGLAREIAQRYVASTYCTWRATGGSQPSLNITQLNNVEANSTGVMFEKYSNTGFDVVGSGGEYEVVPGFGWSNGVLIWALTEFPDLTTPNCTQS